MSRLAVVVALAAGAAAVPAGATVRPTAEVLLLGGTAAHTVTTRARTDPDAWYTITVSGVVSYNRRLTLEDCGHRDDPGPAGWGAWRYPLVDQLSSPCTRMAPHASHTYCWRQRGTGRRLELSTAGYGADDDTGALVVVVERATGPGTADAACPVLTGSPARP